MSDLSSLLGSSDEEWQASLGWRPTEVQQQLFQQLYRHVCQANQQLNLTRITEPTAFWEKHLWDSLSLVFKLGDCLDLSQPLQAIDIGTGGGFPGIPIAIAFPHWSLTLLDSTRKKIQFLQILAPQLGLANVEAIAGRAEAIARDFRYRARYDLCLIRAVADASVCAEYALPLLKVNGIALLYRGHWQDADRDRLLFALDRLRGRLLDTIALTTPLTGSTRHGLVLKKIAPTPAQYPRANGIPAQQPL